MQRLVMRCYGVLILRSHELAKAMLAAPDGKVVCSVDISTNEESADHRCFGDFEEINSLPSEEGFGSEEVQLLFSGCLNY